MKILRDPCPRHKEVAVLGLGVSGLAASRLLLAFGKDLTLSDSRRDLALPDAIAERVSLRLGSLVSDRARLLVLAPSLNPEWPENQTRTDLADLLTPAVQTVAEVDLAASAWPGPLLAVGGTDGKSTTVALCHHLLHALGRPAALGGNSWTPLADVVLDLDRSGRPDTVVCAEVSAFQSWQPLRMRPSVAILTNVADDHLDHYDGMASYARAKKRLLDALVPGTTAILSARDPRLLAWASELESRGVRVVLVADAADDLPRRGPLAAASRAVVDGDDFALALDDSVVRIPRSALRLPGPHNQRNALAALAACAILCGEGALDVDALADGLTTFPGLPHRVQPVRTLGGITWYDDSKATNVHAALAGLGALPSRVVVITGGVDKDLDLVPWVDALASRASHIVVIGQLRERLGAALDARGLAWSPADSMDEAVRHADMTAQHEGASAVLLAPAASSFDMFRSFEHRGEVFQAAVRALPPR